MWKTNEFITQPNRNLINNNINSFLIFLFKFHSCYIRFTKFDSVLYCFQGYLKWTPNPTSVKTNIIRAIFKSGLNYVRTRQEHYVFFAIIVLINIVIYIIRFSVIIGIPWYHTFYFWFCEWFYDTFFFQNQYIIYKYKIFIISL